MPSQHESFEAPWTFFLSRDLSSGTGDFYAAVGGDRLVLSAGKMLKIYDLTVHSGAVLKQTELSQCRSMLGCWWVSSGFPLGMWG